MHTPLNRVLESVGSVILGKPRQIRLCLACLLARGHLLIEDLPGVGKTTLAHVLARSLGLAYQRIQFTSDLLPADILGISIFSRDSGGFEFHPGPIFAQLILADEINRATPKTQSALLEAMEERQVTIEGESRPLPNPFFVIATQNPTFQIGTFPLPESQLDRFLMRIRLGYPDAEAEREMLAGQDRREQVAALEAIFSPQELSHWQNAASEVHASAALIEYIQGICEFSRTAEQYATGLSPRAGLALLHSARAWALLDGRDYALPEDVQQVLTSVATHRLRGREQETDEDSLMQPLLSLPIP